MGSGYIHNFIESFGKQTVQWLDQDVGIGKSRLYRKLTEFMKEGHSLPTFKNIALK